MQYSRHKSGLWLPTDKPPAGWVIDPDHPLSKGLVFCIPFNEGGGASPIELVHKLPATFSGAPTWTVGPRGISLETQGSVYPYWSDHPDYDILGDLTLVWIGSLDIVSSNQSLLSKGSPGIVTYCPFVLHTDSAGPAGLMLTRASTGYRTWRSSGISIYTNAYNVVGVSQIGTIETVPTFYLNGTGYSATLYAGSGTGATLAYSGVDPLRIAMRTDGNAGLDGKTVAVFGWTRVLTADEHRWIAAEPYCMMMAPKSKGTVVPLQLDTELVDFRLNLSTVAYDLKDLATWLRAHDGIEYEDLQTLLAAYLQDTEDLPTYLTTLSQDFEDLMTRLQTWAWRTEDLPAFLKTLSLSLDDFKTALNVAGYDLSDLATFLSTASPTVLADLMTYFSATDGVARSDLATYLSAISLIPAHRAVMAQRLTGVISEVA